MVSSSSDSPGKQAVHWNLNGCQSIWFSCPFDIKNNSMDESFQDYS